jgi:hypothetical protein
LLWIMKKHSNPRYQTSQVRQVDAKRRRRTPAEPAPRRGEAQSAESIPPSPPNLQEKQ